jgi:hypothetical protein
VLIATQQSRRGSFDLRRKILPESGESVIALAISTADKARHVKVPEQNNEPRLEGEIMSDNLDKARVRLEEIMHAKQLIDEKLLRREGDLMMTKWFDYRFMSPWSATWHFADIYREQLKAYLRANVDLGLSKVSRGIPKVAPASPEGWFTQLWMARQAADAMGIPYEMAIDFGFDFASRRTRKMAPRPLQLFANQKTAFAYEKNLETYLENHLPLAVSRLSELPQYQTRNFKRLPAQVALQDYLVAAIFNDPTIPWHRAIGKYVIERRLIPLRNVWRHVPREIRRQVARQIRSDIDDGFLDVRLEVVCAPHELFPSCFAVSEAVKLSSAPCEVCPWQPKCRKAAEWIDTRLNAITGSSSPVADSRREATRKRVAAFRARKKDKLSAALPHPEARF